MAPITALISAVLSSDLSSAVTAPGGAASGPVWSASAGEPLVVVAHPVAASPIPTAASAIASRRNVHMLEITQDGPRAKYHSPTGRCARAIRATAEASH